jgi:LmbE family N-acetylglucosaminyl deacetylase
MGRLDLAEVSRRHVTVLSPHLDDGVLSCGALLAAGADAAVVTVFTGRPEPPLSAGAEEFHRRCGLGPDPIGQREDEDDLALKTVGADAVRLGIPEALYRSDQSGGHRYPDDRDLSAADLGAESALIADLAVRLADEPRVRDADLVLAPLGIGGHVDHRITAAAAERLGREPGTLLWYEDVPYALFPRSMRGPAPRTRRGPRVCRFRAEHWQAKLAAIECYASQRDILWRNRTGLARTLTFRARLLGRGAPAERYWSESSQATDIRPVARP